ncbi:hypothetical protein SAMN04488109_3700 [Chryseolinea serpens]|uniref:Heavy-metal-associated domain-containing protein n=1 Tax=Chryseolinea serpens TaxID=947013 RepID=A0A1M5S148_9BACT|nr:hypothetical protein [Chryseolinea serpens]SHH32372.1 hypothetical protein SAMN04488109_3700 [Chryseolinea serpens]
MKKIKILSLSLVVVLAGLFTYANLRPLSVAEKLPTVDLASYRLKGPMTPAERLALEQKMSALPGVTACSVNKEGRVASVLFHRKEIDEAQLARQLSNKGQWRVAQKALQTSGGCPMHGMTAPFHAFISVLDLRN